MAFYHDARVLRLLDMGGTPISVHDIHTTTNLMDSLLLDFTDIFEEPRGLPPQRCHDHPIQLLSRTTPVVVRPYQYPQLLKDKVER
jgi:hypothetical protein